MGEDNMNNSYVIEMNAHGYGLIHPEKGVDPKAHQETLQVMDELRDKLQERKKHEPEFTVEVALRCLEAVLKESYPELLVETVYTVAMTKIPMRFYKQNAKGIYEPSGFLELEISGEVTEKEIREYSHNLPLFPESMELR
jgi:hypothetical protein